MNIRLETLIIEATRKAFDVANAKLGRAYPYPQILFDLRGTCAGQAFPTLNKIRYNLQIAEKNEMAFFADTIFHEVSHIIAPLYYHCRCGHNREWRSIMRNVFGVEPTRCHNMNTEGCRARRTKSHIYACVCGKELKVGTHLHNIIQRNGHVIHKTCKLTISRAWYKRTEIQA